MPRKCKAKTEGITEPRHFHSNWNMWITQKIHWLCFTLYIKSRSSVVRDFQLLLTRYLSDSRCNTKSDPRRQALLQTCYTEMNLWKWFSYSVSMQSYQLHPILDVIFCVFAAFGLNAATQLCFCQSVGITAVTVVCHANPLLQEIRRHRFHCRGEQKRFHSQTSAMTLTRNS